MTEPIYPCLWFEDQAKAAAEYYCSVLKGAKIIEHNPFVTMLEVKGQKIMCLNGRREFKFNESMSLVINCDTQEEIDHYWNGFTRNGGQESMCGWCKDKYGMSWQIVPAQLGAWMKDPVKGPKVVEAFMKMRKFDIETLKNV